MLIVSGWPSWKHEQLSSSYKAGLLLLAAVPVESPVEEPKPWVWGSDPSQAGTPGLATQGNMNGWWQRWMMHAHTQWTAELLDTPFHHHFRATQQLQFSIHLVNNSIFQNCWDHLQWLQVYLWITWRERDVLFDEKKTWIQTNKGRFRQPGDESWFLIVDLPPTLCEASGYLSFPHQMWQHSHTHLQGTTLELRSNKIRNLFTRSSYRFPALLSSGLLKPNPI